MIDLANPCCPPENSTPLIVPNAGCLEAEAFTYLCDYIRNGGHAIFTPMIPQYDLYGNRNTSLLDLLGAELTEMFRPAGGKVLDYGSHAVATTFGTELSVHSWITAYRFSKPSRPLAYYHGTPVAASVQLAHGSAVVVGFEAIYNNSQSVDFWRRIVQKECGVTPAATESTGSFSLFSRIGEHMQFLAVGNASGTLDPGVVHCAGYTFPLELNPHEGRILVFHAPILDGENEICYSTSEMIPLSADRSTLELHGQVGTLGKIVFVKPCAVTLNGAAVQLQQETDGYALQYEHLRQPSLLKISKG